MVPLPPFGPVPSAPGLGSARLPRAWLWPVSLKLPSLNASPPLSCDHVLLHTAYFWEHHALESSHPRMVSPGILSKVVNGPFTLDPVVTQKTQWWQEIEWKGKD